MLSDDSEEFLSYLAVEKGRAAFTLSSYRRDLVAYEAFLKSRETGLAAVTSTTVEEYLAALAASGRKASSNARALAAIRGLHRFCEDERGGPPDPTAEVPRPRLASPVPKALSEEQVASLLASVVGNGPTELRDRAILELMYATGVRISELCGLDLGDVDLNGRLVRVFGKGSKERIVPFGRYAEEAVKCWLGGSGRPLLAPRQWQRRGDAEALFISSRGRRMSRQAVYLVVRGAAKRCGLETLVTPHVLRHSCATHMLEHGADIRVVQEVLGHAVITTTQIYTRVSGELLRRTFDEAHPRARRRTSAGAGKEQGSAN